MDVDNRARTTTVFSIIIIIIIIIIVVNWAKDVNITIVIRWC